MRLAFDLSEIRHIRLKWRHRPASHQKSGDTEKRGPGHYKTVYRPDIIAVSLPAYVAYFGGQNNAAGGGLLCSLFCPRTNMSSINTMRRVRHIFLKSTWHGPPSARGRPKYKNLSSVDYDTRTITETSLVTVQQQQIVRCWLMLLFNKGVYNK